MATAESLFNELSLSRGLTPPINETPEINLISWRSPSDIDHVIYITRDDFQVGFLDSGHCGDMWMPHRSATMEPVYTARFGNYFVAVTTENPMYDSTGRMFSVYTCALDDPDRMFINHNHQYQIKPRNDSVTILRLDVRIAPCEQETAATDQPNGVYIIFTDNSEHYIAL